ncbi:hypothetical protein [Fodinibius sediminis]|uniref:hypothetical protein n=1 Tax=Fodinibius sediminis TaxID=1214077 RepID=UPI00115B69E5|nr:hypothetical protein [Fodinibius sediminis]
MIPAGHGSFLLNPIGQVHVPDSPTTGAIPICRFVQLGFPVDTGITEQIPVQTHSIAPLGFQKKRNAVFADSLAI